MHVYCFNNEFKFKNENKDNKYTNINSNKSNNNNSNINSNINMNNITNINSNKSNSNKSNSNKSNSNKSHSNKSNSNKSNSNKSNSNKSNNINMNSNKSHSNKSHSNLVMNRKKYNIGLIIAHINENIGSCFGLKNDALLYEKYLNDEWNIFYISPYTLNEKDELERQNIINKCNVIIGFEEMGDHKLISYLKNKTNKIKILIPNLEVMNNNSKFKWYETLNNIDMLDIIISKADCLSPLIEKFIKSLAIGQNNKSIIETKEDQSKYNKLLEQKTVKYIKILNVGHISIPNKLLTDELIYDEEFYNPKKRMNIIHFAGSSSWKNTYENCLAGLEILDQFKLNKLIIKITSFKNDKFNTNQIANFDKLLKLCDENKDKIDLIMNNVITDIEKYNLYKSCRLALCCSFAEGFGHYILEAAYYGCLILTTNGIPMNCLLNKKNTFELVDPISEKKINYGKKYITVSNDIIIAANKLNIMNYDKERIIDCVENYNILKRKFEKNISVLSVNLKSMVENISKSYETKEIFINNVKGGDINKYNFISSNNKLTVYYDKFLNKKIIYYNPLWIDKDEINTNVDVDNADNNTNNNADTKENKENKENKDNKDNKDNNHNNHKKIIGSYDSNNKLSLIYNFNSDKINCLIARKYLMIDNQKNKSNQDKKNILTKYINIVIKKYKYILKNSINDNDINNLVNNLY
jgi:hypothetical protein